MNKHEIGFEVIVDTVTKGGIDFVIRTILCLQMKTDFDTRKICRQKCANGIIDQLA